jgi:hypothetical protein
MICLHISASFTINLSFSLTKLFACWDISQSPICDDLALSISHPSYVLFLGRVVEHATQSEYNGLCDFAITVDIHDWPIAERSQILCICDISGALSNGYVD